MSALLAPSAGTEHGAPRPPAGPGGPGPAGGAGTGPPRASDMPPPGTPPPSPPPGGPTHPTPTRPPEAPRPRVARHTAVVAGTHVVLAAGAALLLAPAITQQLWTDRLVLPVLAAALLPMYLALTLVPRRTVTNVPAGRAEAPASTVSTPGRPGASTAPPAPKPAGATSPAPAGAAERAA